MWPKKVSSMNKSLLADILLAQLNSWPGQNNYIFLPFIAVKTRLEGKVFIEIAGAGKNALRAGSLALDNIAFPSVERRSIQIKH